MLHNTAVCTQPWPGDIRAFLPKGFPATETYTEAYRDQAVLLGRQRTSLDTLLLSPRIGDQTQGIQTSSVAYCITACRPPLLPVKRKPEGTNLVVQPIHDGVASTVADLQHDTAHNERRLERMHYRAVKVTPSVQTDHEPSSVYSTIGSISGYIYVGQPAPAIHSSVFSVVYRFP